MAILWALNACSVFAKHAEFSLKWVVIISFVGIIGIRYVDCYLSKEDDLSAECRTRSQDTIFPHY